MTQLLERITHQSTKPATHSIIWLHGLGADGHDFATLLPALSLEDTTRVIFPHAPLQAVSINQGMQMRAWYDIRDLNFAYDDVAGINASCAAVLRIYQQEIQSGISPQNIVFAGFSQGGVIALCAGSRVPCRGILALSTYLPEQPAMTAAGKPAPEIVQIHGRYDPVIAFTKAQQATQRLNALGYPVKNYEFSMGHEVNMPSIERIAQTLKSWGC